MSEMVPKIRFSSFTDDWEINQFSTLAKVSRGLTYKPTDVQKNGVRVLRSSNILDDKFVIRSDDIFVNRDVVKIDRVRNSDILITSANGSSRLVGKHAIINGIEGEVVHGGFMLVAKAEQPEFVNALMSSPWYLKFINVFVSGGNGSIGNLSKTDLDQQNIYVPNKDEQSQIGLFFQKFDDIINFHQRKLDLLKEQKKGFLQKMFPKDGQPVPEVRFEGFTDDWEQRKLSELADHRGGTAIEKYFEKDGKYKVISIGSYGLDSKYVDQNIRAVSNEVTDGRVVQAGELTMVLNDKTANGTIIGRTLLIEQDNEYVINQRTEIISPKENFNASFAYTLLNGPFRGKVKRIVQGGTQIYVNYPVVSNLDVEIPNIQEQQKIGSLFKHLDTLITLHQRKLDSLKEQKKGFLQKMFVP